MNVTLPPVSARAQPSGTSRWYAPAVFVYLTKACESGISPGGFTSGATAVSVEAIGVSAPVVRVIDDAVVLRCGVSLFAVKPTDNWIKGAKKCICICDLWDSA